MNSYQRTSRPVIVGTIVHELKSVVPPTLFFLIAFNLLVLTVALMAQGQGGSVVNHAAASLAALVVGKAVLVADHLPFFNRFPEKPLIWNTLWKAGLYWLVTLAFRLVEKLLSAAAGDNGFSAGVTEEVAAFAWPRFWAVQLWLVILFVIYAFVRELVRALGRDRVVAMVFGPLAKGGPPGL
jgi:hypothetical protein